MDFLRNSKKPTDRGVLVEPTGSGKSIITATIANELKSGVLVLQPSKELLEQNYAKFVAYGGQASIFSESMKQKEVGEVTFATIGSIKGRQAEFSHVRYVLIDECHLVPPAKQTGNRIIHSMFTEFIYGLQDVQDIRVVGLTATPFRLKKFRDPWTKVPYSQINLLNRMRPLFFNKFLHVTQVKELYEQGFLCPVKYTPLNWDGSKLVVNTTGADFTEDSMDRALIAEHVIERLPAIVEETIKAGRKYRIVFVASVADAEYLKELVPDSECVSSDTKPKERERILTAFKAGEIKTVFNVGVLTIGFDFPALDTIIIARPTMSFALYMQMIGRGIRPHESKTECEVIDMCGNHARFGEIETVTYSQSSEGQKLWELRSGKKLLSNVALKA